MEANKFSSAVPLLSGASSVLEDRLGKNIVLRSHRVEATHTALRLSPHSGPPEYVRIDLTFGNSSIFF